jgi:hypothetical protein
MMRFSDAEKANSFLAELQALVVKHGVTAGVFGWFVGTAEWRAAVFGGGAEKAGLLIELREEVERQVRPNAESVIAVMPGSRTS